MRVNCAIANSKKPLKALYDILKQLEATLQRRIYIRKHPQKTNDDGGSLNYILPILETHLDADAPFPKSRDLRLGLGYSQQLRRALQTAASVRLISEANDLAQCPS